MAESDWYSVFIVYIVQVCDGGPLNFIELLMDRRVPLFISQSQIQTIRDKGYK